MCLILFSFKTHPEYKLIIAANRDEFYQRPASSADYWDDYPDILGGRDLTACGTWLGVTKKGRLSMITNFRDLSNLKAKAPSRGNLVADFLKKEKTPKQYLEDVKSVGNAYNGFNLVLGTIDDLWYYSNQKDRIYQLGSGIYGLSNALLDTSWPKVETGKKKFSEILEQAQPDPEELLTMLFDNRPAAENLLPDTGVGLELEKVLSPMFIKSPNYGTRCSTVILVNNSNEVSFTERVYNTDSFEASTKSFTVKI